MTFGKGAKGMSGTTSMIHPPREPLKAGSHLLPIHRRTLVMGLQDYGRGELEAARDSGQRLRIHALGLVRIAEDVTPELALAAIESISVLGALHASPAVKAALAARIH